MLVDADTQAKAPAFDHARLADALSTALGRKVTAAELPFNEFTFTPDLRRIEFQLAPRPRCGTGARRTTGAALALLARELHAARRSRVRRAAEGAADAAAAGWRARCGAEFDINGAEPQARPTASSRR